jgi:hypothetical protein
MWPVRGLYDFVVLVQMSRKGDEQACHRPLILLKLSPIHSVHNRPVFRQLSGNL